VSPADGRENLNRYLILAAMIFAVAMTFIDQTIVSISIPQIQKDLKLSSTGVQWVINGYLISLAALFALGGKIADVAGRRRVVVLGVVIFAAASTLCGATPAGSLAEPWLIVFRVIQGAGAALMFPAALAIVISSFPIDSRGKAMAIFFGISGGLTAVGPIAGGYLSEWTWRAIFWINIPVALISLFLIWRSKPENSRRDEPIDYRGAVLIAAGMGLAVLGLQQSAAWGWSSPATLGSIAAGLVLLAWFVVYELRVEHPLIRIRIFESRGFSVDNAILLLLSMAFIPLFFFASTYSQISLGWQSSEAGLYLLIFFAGFATASQWGGKVLDRRGARPAVVLGSLIAAVGFALWAGKLTDLDGGAGAQWPFIVLTGIGIGLVLGPASTDAVNRAPNTSYGEATGITQTVRNFGAAVGLAVLGTVLVSENRSNIESSFTELGVPASSADRIASSLSQAGGGDSSTMIPHAGAKASEFFHAVQLDYAMSTRTVFYVMGGVMAVCFVVALIGSPPGRMKEIIADDSGEDPAISPAAAARPDPGSL
jgi:EmrB/QacA subfamily drug resistance transporter